MKKVFLLILKCAAALLPLWLIIIYIAAKPLAYLSSDSVGAYWNRCFTNESHEKYNDVVILGDSMAATSFMPELLSDTTINLALSGSSPVEGYYTLKDYLKNNDAPSDVFVSYMDYHLAHDDFTFETCNQVHKFSLSDYIEIYKTIKAAGANQFEDIDMDSYWDKALASSFYMPSEYIASIINSIKESGRYDANKEIYDDITVHSGRYCHMTNDISESTGISYNDYAVSSLQNCYYTKLVKLCEDKGIRLHIVKLPLDSNTMFTDQYVGQVSAYYTNLLADTSLAEFKWYPADYAVEWFWDDYHMNQHGSYRFSMQLKQDYSEIWGDYSASAGQMLAINEDILLENELPELFKWIDRKDYTIIIKSDLDDFDGIFNAYFRYNEQYVQRVNEKYIVQGKDDNSLPDTKKYDDLFGNYDINVLVIDNTNNVVVRACGVNWPEFKLEDGE